MEAFDPIYYQDSLFAVVLVALNKSFSLALA
jgi:hypothetical protein